MRPCVRPCVLLLLACAASACVDDGTAPAASASLVATPALVDPTVAPATAYEPPDPVAARYLAHKRVFERLADEGDSHFVPQLASAEDAALSGLADAQSCMDTEACAFDLMTCDDGTDYIAGFNEAGRPIDPAESRTASAAFQSVWFERTLSRLGYPPAVWQPALAGMETAYLALLRAPPAAAGPDDDPFLANDRIEDEARGALLPLLNAYRAQENPALPLAYIEGGCGAGEIGITVATSPANGVVQFIPVFFHRLCSVQGIDPDDPGTCDHWREPAEGVLFDVAGDYRYRAYWPDGSRRTGTLAFTNLEDGQTVTIRKP